MASPQLLRVLLQLLLASGFASANPTRRLTSRPLHDASSASTASLGSSTESSVVGRSRDSGSTAGTSTDPSLRTNSSSPPAAAAASPPWELELAPYLTDLPMPLDPNASVLRGPLRLGGVFKGSWLRTAYGASLRPQDTLASARGVILLRLPEGDASQTPVGDLPGEMLVGGGAAHLPGGVQELRGELVIRDGELVTDRDLRFRLKGVYVPAAGTVHAVLEPAVPGLLALKAELADPDSAASASIAVKQDPNSDLDSGSGMDLDSDLGLLQLRQQHGLAGAAAAAGAGRGPGGGDGNGGGGGGGDDGSGYREALRTAARNLVLLGPAWHRTLVRQPPPPPPGPPRGHHGRGGGGRFRRAAVEADAEADIRGGIGRLPPPPPPSPPRPPLELALLQTCELRADFRVYYKGDPSAQSHARFLHLDQPAAPPLKPPPPGTPPPPPGPAGHGGGAVRQQRRQLAADTEIYHSTQMQLHSLQQPTASTSASAAAAASGGDGDAAAAPESAVYGIPPGMDPSDPDLELVGLVLSPNCDFVLHFNASSVHLERYFRQALRYSAMVATVTIAQIVLSVIQAEAASTPSAAARMSLYCVTSQAILDAYQCLLHLTGALVVDALFAAFASVSFLQFLLFAVFEMQQTLLVWRAQRAGGTGLGTDFWSARRDMSAVYFRFYGLMLLGLLLIFQFRSQLPLLVLALHSWWLPQMAHSATTDTRPPLSGKYVWGMSACRLVLPLYLYGCPANLLRVEPHPGVCLALVVWVGLQAAALMAQVRFGPRVFIPRAFLPRRYDYHRPATKREMGLEEADGGAGTGHQPQAQPSSSSAAAASSAVAAAAAGAGSAGPWWRRWWWWRGWWPYGAAGRALPPPLRRLASWLRRQTAAAGGGITALRRVAAAAAAGGRRADGGFAADGSASVDLETGHGSKECVICMNPVPLLPLRSRMLTPCGHFFHEPCLTRWMEVKMDCPTCRRPLPPA